MLMKAITNNQYIGLRELYRKFDTKVTGYSVMDDKPISKEAIRLYVYRKLEILLFVMLVTLLTGCGGGSGDSSIQAGGETSIEGVVETSIEGVEKHL